MATKIRLRRTGTTNLATFRIVAADSQSPRDGRFLEILGSYDPRKVDAEKVSVKTERVQYWIGHGAQVTDAVKPLLKLAGIELPVKARRKSKKSVASGTTAEVLESTVAVPEDVPVEKSAPVNE
jgi:small subunit ribosomal protein S16